MKQSNILQTLKERAKEQQLLQHIPYAPLFFFISENLGENPWKIIFIFSFSITIIFHFLLGRGFDEWILWLFGNI